MNQLPLISVIIPCYNQAKFLHETCNSLISQTYTNWEAIIVNDGSTDHTEKIANDICIKNSRFKLINQPNQGLSSARNTGLKNSSGKFIQFLDSDDLLSPHKLQSSIELMNQEETDIVISNFFRFKSKNGKEKKSRFNLKNHTINFESILLKWDIEFAIPIHCALFSSNIINNTRFNEFVKAKEDWIFWLDIMIKKPKIIYYNSQDALYRAHKNNMSKNFKLMQLNNESANRHIFKKLTEEHKELFFKRINSELSKSRISFFLFKQSLFSRKITTYFKSFLSC